MDLKGGVPPQPAPQGGDGVAHQGLHLRHTAPSSADPRSGAASHPLRCMVRRASAKWREAIGFPPSRFSRVLVAHAPCTCAAEKEIDRPRARAERNRAVRDMKEVGAPRQDFRYWGSIAKPALNVAHLRSHESFSRRRAKRLDTHEHFPKLNQLREEKACRRVARVEGWCPCLFLRHRSPGFVRRGSGKKFLGVL